jgi:two-component system chemotaxis sensor kinase CheA
MAIRAQPVKSVFQRMPRLVREIATRLGKEVRMVTSGEATEIDKTVIEQLADPLTHLVRNALDHGLETPAERQAAGKHPEGTLLLSAEHRGGRILIEISDDGRGINRPRVLEKAQQKGLVPPSAALSDTEIDNLIFMPGFSTAETVSNISGRGVGMDVVRRNIQALGGRVTVSSQPGHGSRFTLSLPLTLAVLDGLVVAVGAESYIVPLTSIVESLRPRVEDVHAVVGRGDVLAIRGAYVPLVYLHEFFLIRNAIREAHRGIVVIVECDQRGHLGLVVDDLLGQQQVVVKSLEENYHAIDGIGGATILGNGRVALILDVAGVGVATPGASTRPIALKASSSAGQKA